MPEPILEGVLPEEESKHFCSTDCRVSTLEGVVLQLVDQYQQVIERINKLEHTLSQIPNDVLNG